MVLQKNIFVEKLLPGAILRRLSEDEMAAYRAPFANAGEDRRQTLTWLKSDPVSLDTVWTTMTAAKEAGHARQAAEGHSSW